MKQRNSSFTAQGALSLFAISIFLGYAAHAVQPQPERSAAFYAQEPTPKPATPDQVQPTQPDQNAAKSTVITGTIVKDGSSFVLRASSGEVYKLDTPDKAQQFEGKSVKVTGKLEESAKLIHVENIEELSA
jgi:hypothetical protein